METWTVTAPPLGRSLMALRLTQPGALWWVTGGGRLSQRGPDGKHVVMETSRRTRADGCTIAGGWLWLGTEAVVGTAAVVGTSFPFRGGRCSHWGVTLEVAFVTSDAEVNVDVGDWGKVCPGVADVTPAGEAERGADPTAGFTVDLSPGLHTSSEVQCRDSWEAGRGPKASVECSVDWAVWAP